VKGERKAAYNGVWHGKLGQQLFVALPPNVLPSTRPQLTPVAFFEGEAHRREPFWISHLAAGQLQVLRLSVILANTSSIASVALVTSIPSSPMQPSESSSLKPRLGAEAPTRSRKAKSLLLVADESKRKGIVRM
jgi:hypothetical protein